MKTVLITGVAGFLGRYIARQYVQEGWRVVGLDDTQDENAPRDVEYHRMRLPSAELADVLRAHSPGLCVHCAGRASVPLSVEDPSADFHGNTVLTFQMLDSIRRAAPQCAFLLLSSAAVYGNPRSLPITEDHACAPISPYGFHKWQCEILCEEFRNLCGIRATALRIFSAYGPGLRRQVIWDICAKAIDGRDVQLHGSGEESRDFVHARDVAHAVFRLSEAQTWDPVYNLAAGEETTVRELATYLLQELDSSGQITFSGVAHRGQPHRWCADISRLRRLGYAPRISLRQGLHDTAAWCRAELGGL